MKRIERPSREDIAIAGVGFSSLVMGIRLSITFASPPMMLDELAALSALLGFVSTNVSHWNQATILAAYFLFMLKLSSGSP